MRGQLPPPPHLSKDGPRDSLKTEEKWRGIGYVRIFQRNVPKTLVLALEKKRIFTDF